MRTWRWASWLGHGCVCSVRLLTEEGRPLEQRVSRLLEAADDVTRGGGADNLGVVALEG